MSREKNLITYGLASILLSASFLMTVPANQYQNIFAQTEGELQAPIPSNTTETPPGHSTIPNPSWTGMLTGVQLEQFNEQFNKLSEQFQQDVSELVSSDPPTEACSTCSTDIDDIQQNDVVTLAKLFDNYKQETLRIFGADQSTEASGIETSPAYWFGEYDSQEYDSLKDQASSAPPGVDPNKCIPGNECPPVCPDGFILASPPLNPQLGCLPESVTTEQQKMDEEQEETEGVGELMDIPLKGGPISAGSAGTMNATNATSVVTPDEEQEETEDGEPEDGNKQEDEVSRNDDTDSDRSSR